MVARNAFFRNNVILFIFNEEYSQGECEWGHFNMDVDYFIVLHWYYSFNLKPWSMSDMGLFMVVDMTSKQFLDALLLINLDILEVLQILL